MIVRALTILLLVVSSSMATPYLRKTQKEETSQLWETGPDHEILFRGQPAHFKGINWFSTDSCGAPNGLDRRSVDSILDFLAYHRFNLIRLPITYEMMDNLNGYPNPSCLAADPGLSGITIGRVYEIILEKARDKGISVVVDLHTVRGQIHEYPWDTLKWEDIFAAWGKFIRAFQGFPNLLALDIANEPHGSIGWDLWGGYTTAFIHNITMEYPAFQGMFMVEGIQQPTAAPWGGSFETLPDDAIPIKERKRVIWSPHVYGVSVRGDMATYEGDQQFEAWFGNLLDRFPNPILIGETGGFMTDQDLAWHSRLKEYLIRKNIRNAAYWCLNPNSRDTSGLFMDEAWSQVNWEKIKFMEELQPEPTKFVF